MATDEENKPVKRKPGRPKGSKDKDSYVIYLDQGLKNYDFNAVYELVNLFRSTSDESIKFKILNAMMQFLFVKKTSINISGEVQVQHQAVTTAELLQVMKEDPMLVDIEASEVKK